MTTIEVLLFPVSFALQARGPRMVTLTGAGGELLRAPARDPDRTAQALLKDCLARTFSVSPTESEEARAEFETIGSRFLDLAGAWRDASRVHLVYTATIPVPFAEQEFGTELDPALTWTTLNASRPDGGSARAPGPRMGAEAVVLDYWRQALEETDAALDFFGEYLSLHQLRSVYDAVWGYPQDPSGFKRWAVDRRGAFQDLLVDVDDRSLLEDAFFQSLGRLVPPQQAARAGAIATTGVTASTPLPPELALPMAVAAATTVNRLYRNRGPEPAWFKKSPAWRPGPTWIENLYPPRPSWTTWDTVQGATRQSAVAH